MEALISKLGLVPLLQANSCVGWFKEEHRSSLVTQSTAIEDSRTAVTVIYHLMSHEQKSKWHRLSKNDEIIVFNQGKPMQIDMINCKGEYSTCIIGIDSFHCVVPCGSWFTQQPITQRQEEYSLCTVCVAPGFDVRDLEVQEIGQMQMLFPSLNLA